MAAKIIDGKLLSGNLREQLKKDTAKLQLDEGVVPGLAVVLVGENPASKVYVKNKAKACEALGYHSEQHNMPEDTTTNELLNLVHKLNNDDKIHGILVQLPLPKAIDEDLIIDAIDPNKDVDAFHKNNQGAILRGEYNFLPCTPAGIIELIKSTGVAIEGLNCVVIGRSNIVGKPVAMMLLKENATVTICHSKTINLAEHCKRADLLIAAIGIPKFVTADYVKDGAIVIDVGINRDENGKLCGDVDFDDVIEIAGYITPVPGGVGPMTITELMKNTYNSAVNHIGKI